MSKELKRMQKLAGVLVNEKKENINEVYVAGGIVGVGAITQIPPREKSDYEMAFEYFMNEGEKKGEDFINPGNTEDDQAKKDAYDYDARPAHMKEGEDSTYEEDDTMEEGLKLDPNMTVEEFMEKLLGPDYKRKPQEKRDMVSKVYDELKRANSIK